MVDSHVITFGSWSGSRRNVTIDFYDGATKVYSLDFFGPPEQFDDAFAITLYPSINNLLGEQEFIAATDLIDHYQNPDTITTYLSQVDFDRRLLGYIMTVQDCHKVNACLPFWQAVQPRNGSNATERAATLGVSESEYDQVAARMNDYFGVSTFLSDDIAAVWPDPGLWV